MARRSVIKKRVKTERKVAKSVYNLTLGQAPKPPADGNWSQLQKVYNWYNERFRSTAERKEAKEWVVEYMSASSRYNSTDRKLYESSRLSMTTSTMFTNARLILDGYTLPEGFEDRLEASIRNAIGDQGKDEEEGQESEETEPSSKPSIQERTKDVQSDIIGNVLGQIDDGIEDLYSFLQKHGVKPTHTRALCEKLRSNLEEIRHAAEWTDPQLKEGYAHLGRAGTRKLLAVYERLVADCDRHFGNLKAAKAPKKPKEKSAAQQVTKVLYLKQHAELQLQSVDPTNIIGAMNLWVYNVRYKTLAHYVSREASGFKVKGTTIQNFDVDVSEQRALRKPEKTLREVLNATPTGAKKVMSALTTKPGKPNGRINEQTVLLRASR